MNPILTFTLLTALLQSSLLVSGAWLLILTQGKASAARRSAAGRFTMAGALGMITAMVIYAALFPTPDRNHISGPAALPQGAGFIAENTLLNPSESPAAEKTSSSPAVKPIANPSSADPLKLSAGHARWLGAAWLTGAALVLTAWLGSLAARLALLRRSENAAGVPWLEIAGEVKGWPLVDQVRLIPQEITPCVWGVRKTVLALPASAESWPAAKLKLVLAHECAHLLRRDPLWQILSRFFLALLWFHPLAWSVARRSQAADEQAADDTVLGTECDAPAYAGLLVECARQFSLPPTLQPTASAMANAGTLTRRVEAVLDPATDRRPAGAASLTMGVAAISLLTAAACLASPPIEVGPPTPPAPEKPVTTPDPTAPTAVPASQEPSKVFDPPIPPSSVPHPIPADPDPAAESPAETELETPDSPKIPFEWKTVSVDGRDYLPVSNIKSFYKFPRLIAEESGTFFLRSPTMVIKGATGSKEIFVNNVRFFLKHPVLSSDGGAMISRHDLSFMLDPIIRPAYIKGFEKVTTVVIDAGHGGYDSGANGSFGKESTYTLDAAQRLQRLLEERGIKALLTRTDDSFVPLKVRSAFAAAQSDAILISLHFNSVSAASQQGIVTYFPEEPPTVPGPEQPPESSNYSRACLGLATAVHANSLYKVRGTDGGVRSAGFSVISGQTKTPAILIEGGYLSHPAEAARIAQDEYRQTLAEAIAGGVQNYIRARTNRPPAEQ